MQSKQENKMSKEEIIKYVDDLIKANKRAYDKRLSPLLYAFFLRANEKFEWYREEFLQKYQNFKNNVKEIKITDMEKVGMQSFWTGGFSYGEKKGIYLNEKYIENVKNEPTEKNIVANIIDNLFHECLHATDLIIENEKIKENGLYHIGNSDARDTMLNEYANVLSSSLISSDKTMYTDNYGIDFINNGSYAYLKCPGEIMCAAFDITEPELAKLKDKGAKFFYEYLKNKFPYVNIEASLYVFKTSLNVIYNATNDNDKENISLGFKNIINVAQDLIQIRLGNALNKGKDSKETLERIEYNIFKCKQIIRSLDRIYGLDENNKILNDTTISIGRELEEKVKIYNRFLNNEELFTQEEKEKIRNAKNAKNLIESKFDDDYIDIEFDIEEIVRKYYPQSNEPLNDNTELIEKIKRTILKPTIKDRITKAIENIKNAKLKTLKLLPLPEVNELSDIEETEGQTRAVANISKRLKFKNSVKYETPTIHNTITEQQEQPDISRDDEESAR